MVIDEIFDPVSEELDLVEEELKSQIDSIVNSHSSGPRRGFIKRAIQHLFNTPGKRLRPALVLLTAKSLGNTDASRRRSLVQLATAMELLHSASLIHDDIIDEGIVRRKQMSLNKKYGNQVAVLTGDIIYSQFFALVTDLEELSCNVIMKLLKLLCETTQKMCVGEIQELRMNSRNKPPSLPEYLEILENKTASLMSSCCGGSAILSDADDEMAHTLAGFGLNIGLAYQLIDDYIDNDALVHSDVDLLDSARNHLHQARESIHVLQPSKFKKSFLDLCAFILERAEKKRLVTPA